MERDKKAILRINAAADAGLTDEQAKQRRASALDNRPAAPPSRSAAEITAENLSTYFNFIFLVIALMLIFAGKYRDLTFLPVIIANTLIGIIQELRAKRVLDRITMMNAPVTTVIRSGREITIPSNEAVLDDIAVFRAGDQIAADAVVISGNAAVNEALLTGESDEILKKCGDELMSGSFVVSGECRARLERVGSDSYISRLTIQAKKTKKGEQSEMIRSLNRIVRLAGIVIIPIGALLFCQQHFIEGLNVNDSIQSMAAAVIGMIPEGLFLLASTTLVISTVRLASQKVLVHDMKCIEALARVDTLCVDKTGTITENRMTVEELIPIALSEKELFGLISDLAAAQSADNATMTAIKEYFSAPSGQKLLSASGFTAKYKYSGAVFEKKAYILGAPDFILKNDPALSELISPRIKKGKRILAFAEYSGIPDGKALTGNVTPLGAVVLSNPIRKNAPEAFRFFEEQGVEIKVISGDDPSAVSEISRQAGISASERYIDASLLTSDDALEAAATEYTVFGRVTPEQKRKLVRALKRAGRTVAMTGDGVNDVLALKDADCSAAMASGSEAAAQASQLVLLDSDFSKMPEIVMEGRKVVNNLERSGSLFLVKNIFSVIMAVLAVISGIKYPLKPANVSLISMFTIGFPGLCLSQLPNKELIRGKFMTNILMNALPAGLTDAFIVAGMVFCGHLLKLDQEDISTASTILLGVVGMMILMRISKPMNGIKWAVWVCCGLLIIFSMIFLGGFFSISGISLQAVILCVILALSAEPMIRVIDLVTKKIHIKKRMH